MNIIDETAMSMCGTPEYLAPEVLQKQGHGKPVDWWCLGAILYEMVVGIPPFYSKSRHDLFEKIRNQPVQIPLYLSSKVKNLIEGLLTKKSESRLCSNSGAFEIRNHPWFEGMDWNGLINKTIKVPFIPTIKSDVDVSNFDAEFT
jgi:serum/glucocorticoid-regulated kinase 2